MEYLDDGRYQRVYPAQGPQFVVKVMPTPNVLYRYIQPSGSGQAWTDPKFLLRDHPGSVDVVATWNGALRDFEYDPFGG